MESELEQIDFIDSCTGEEDEEEVRSRGGEPVSLSSQFMAYIERRITREVCVLHVDMCCSVFVFCSFFLLFFFLVVQYLYFWGSGVSSHGQLP